MAIESLMGLIKNHLDCLGARKIAPEEANDYWLLLGRVALDLEKRFDGSQIGVMELSEADDEQLAGCVRRLLAKKGNTLEKIADGLVEMAGLPDLKTDKFLHAQYRAVIRQSLENIQEGKRTSIRGLRV